MNSVELIGRLVKDPMQGKNMAMFTLAVDRMGEGTDYPQVTVFNKQAETVMKYLHKGSQVAVQGRIQTGNYEKNGQIIYYTEIVANRVEFIGGGTKPAETGKKEASDTSGEVYDDFESIDEDVPF